MSEAITLSSPAKVNLFLKVTGRRADGYHTLVTVMTKVSLYDEIIIELGGRGFTITSSDQTVPTDRRNTVHRAVTLLAGETGFLPEEVGIRIHIEKNIPSEAGLGGGSSNAAVVMDALNAHLALGINPDRLMALAAQVGADVPFFLFGSPALATGIGDVLEPISGIPPAWMVIVKPPQGVSTAWAYDQLDFRLTEEKKNIIIPTFSNTLTSLIENMVNDFETVVMQGGPGMRVDELRGKGEEMKGGMHGTHHAGLPDISAVKAELRRLGSLGALMSGSGSGVFGIFQGRMEAQRAYDALSTDSNRTVFLAHHVFDRD
ncbi:MAG: 4-(cytidine 5'-diphospho)-2-C-methyl-D-erythritol kinase [Deltaproteobacteria bacterium]|nr:4-(cytidine 5'-diphospho)-2-C-methyl-D-erythritol kinase [Candidatus Zymogenaceae bacterium]